MAADVGVVSSVAPVAPEFRRGASGWGKAVVAISDVVDLVNQVTFVALIVAYAVVMLVGVFYRYVLNDSLVWSDELSQILFIWAMFMAIASGYLHDQHVRFDMAVTNVEGTLGTVLKVLADGLELGFLLVMTLSSFQAQSTAGTSMFMALRVPLTVGYIAVPIACVIMCFHWIRRNMACAESLAPAAFKLALGLIFFWLVCLPFGQFVQLDGALRAGVLLALLFIPMLIGVPVSICLGLLSAFYLGSFGDLSLKTATVQMFGGVNQLSLLAIPVLLLAGKLMSEAGMAKLLVDFAQALVGRIRGGLGAANVIASYLFTDISGSTIAGTATIGSLMIPQMKERGYKAAFCAALQGSAGTLGMMAPLSITILLYASATNTSVSRLASATILPSLLVVVSFILIVMLYARRDNLPRETVPASQILPTMLKSLPPLSALAVILFGIIGGIVTPAEVGSVLIAYVVLLMIFLYRKATWRGLYAAALEGGYVSGMTMFLVATSTFMGFVLARDMVSTQMGTFVDQFHFSKLMLILVISFIFIILGMFLEPAPMIFGFLPVFIPLLNTAGVDPIHWGVLFCANMGLGCIVPPVALNLFITTQIAGSRYNDVVKASMPFIVIMIVDMLLIAAFPQIPLAIPHWVFDYPIK